MKNIIYILVILLSITTTISCVDDDVFNGNSGPIVAAEVKLNEIMSTGSPDWLELYNTGIEDIDLSGYKLTDSKDKWMIPNMTISAGGYVTFICDNLDTNGSTNFKISSSGEKITLYNATGELINVISTPDMSTQTGLTYGREVDGSDVWVVLSPSKGLANSNVNAVPVINAKPLTEFIDLYTIGVSDAGGVASVKLVHMINNGVQSIDMALVDGKYKTSVPRAKVGDVVKYYIIATDNTGLTTYYPKNGSTNPAKFTVAGGLEELKTEGKNAGFRGQVTFTASPYYPKQVDEIRLYYLLPGKLQDDVNDNKTKVVLTQNGNNYVGMVPERNTDDIISYYLRVEYIDGTKTYYPLEKEDAGGNVISDFNHDQGTTWPTYTVKAITYNDVVNTTVNYTTGPLATIVFPSNPVPGTDINIVLAYSSTVNITEARIYFDVGDNPIYVKKNKVKGEDDASFTQTGVTINLKDVVADSGLAIGKTSAKTTFYIRMADAGGREYYFGHNGSIYLDDTGAGGTTDQSDTFKGDISLWNVFNVQ